MNYVNDRCLFSQQNGLKMCLECNIDHYPNAVTDEKRKECFELWQEIKKGYQIAPDIEW
jgi:hypothetical protein